MNERNEPGKNHGCRHRRLPKPTGKLKRCLREMNILLSEHNGKRMDGSVASSATRYRRARFFEQMIRTLHAQRYRLEKPQSLGGKHLIVLFDHWLEKGLSASTIANNLSNLKAIEEWLGKDGMLNKVIQGYPRKEELLDAKKRTYVARESKAWEGQGIDAEEVIGRVAASDHVVATQLRLQYAFGLRSRESWLLRPHRADKGKILYVTWGTKGGRPRFTVPIETDYQRSVLEEAKRLAPGEDSTTIPPAFSLRTWKNHFYYILRKHGITKRELGVTSHGLRHGYVQRRFREIVEEYEQTTEWTQVKSQPSPKQILSEELGHSREQIMNCYLGPSRDPLVRRDKEKPPKETTRWSSGDH